ncbi:MAG: calcium-binding protein [Acidimicrobiia bacterium]
MSSMSGRCVSVVALVAGLLVVTAGSAPSKAQTPTCFGEAATIIAEPGVVTVGTSGADVIVGTAGADVIRGRGGADKICARGGADRVFGGAGADRINLGSGNDFAKGGKGDDVIIGKKGRDEIYGNGGEDRLVGGSRADVLWGGKRSDRLLGGSGPDVLHGNSGADELLGDKGSDDCYGGTGRDIGRSCELAASLKPPPLSFTQAEWTISGRSIFMIAEVEPLTEDEIEDLGGRLVWDETEIELCATPPPGGTFIEVRYVGDDLVGIGDGFEAGFQGEGCAINEAMGQAFDDFGPPQTACVWVRANGVETEYCAPLGPLVDDDG